MWCASMLLLWVVCSCIAFCGRRTDRPTYTYVLPLAHLHLLTHSSGPRQIASHTIVNTEQIAASYTQLI